MQMEIDNITIKDLEVQFISNKENNFKTMMYYFKIVDFEAKKKLRLFNKLSETLRKPIWKTDDDEYLLKVKASCIEKVAIEKKERFNVELVLVGYADLKDKENIKGYYARLINMKYLDDGSSKGSDKIILNESD